MEAVVHLEPRHRRISLLHIRNDEFIHSPLFWIHLDNCPRRAPFDCSIAAPRHVSALTSPHLMRVLPALATLQEPPDDNEVARLPAERERLGLRERVDERLRRLAPLRPDANASALKSAPPSPMTISVDHAATRSIGRHPLETNLAYLSFCRTNTGLPRDQIGST
jgi:hypothetical protein